MPKLSCSTLAIGATQLVVQEALEMIVVLAGSYVVVVHAHDDGEVLALGRRRDDDLLRAARSMCACALVGVGEEAGRLDDDVDAEVAPRQRAGSRSASTLIVLPSTVMTSSSADVARQRARDRCRTSAGGRASWCR